MLFQTAIACFALFSLALAHAQGTDDAITVTVQSNVYSTAYAVVTMTGEPPAESSVGETIYSIFTSVYSSDVVYASDIPISTISSPISSYANASTTAPHTSFATAPSSAPSSAPASASDNSTIPSTKPSPSSSAPPDSGANGLSVPCSLAFVLMAVYVGML